MPEVTFQPKSSWQKDGCLFCDRPATLEAVAQGGRANSLVRCCDSEDCKKRAADLALIPARS